MDLPGLPRLEPDVLRAHREVTSALLEWAGTVHHLVVERLAHLATSYAAQAQPFVDVEAYVGRVLAEGQYPFPAGVAVYDDPASAYSYDQVVVLAGDDGDDVRVEFSGRYPDTAADGTVLELVTAAVHCPGWLLTDADGPERFRQQTERLARRSLGEVAADADRAQRLLDELLERPAE